MSHIAIQTVQRLVDENKTLEQQIKSVDKEVGRLIIKIKGLEIRNEKFNERVAYHLTVQIELEEKRKAAAKRAHRLQLQNNSLTKKLSKVTE